MDSTSSSCPILAKRKKIVYYLHTLKIKTKPSSKRNFKRKEKRKQLKDCRICVASLDFGLENKDERNICSIGPWLPWAPEICVEWK